MKQKTFKPSIKPIWLAGVVIILLMIAVLGKIYGGLKEDKFCFTTHVPTTLRPNELKSAQDWLQMGDFDYESGNCTQAISDLDQAIKLNPKYAQAYNNRGYVKIRLRQYPQSLPDFDAALKLRPNYLHALMNQGDTYHNLGNDVKALANYDQVISLGKDAIKSESVCGHREMVLNRENFLITIWHAWTRADDCWKMYFEK